METNLPGDGLMSSRPDASALLPLTGSDEFEIADGYPEVRGWDVRDADRSIGYVHDLLIDRDTMRARYLDVELDAPDIGATTGRRLIPIETVSIDSDDEVVSLQGLDVADVEASMPSVQRRVAPEHTVPAAIQEPPRPMLDTPVPVPVAAGPADLHSPAELVPNDLEIGDLTVHTTVRTEQVGRRVPIVREELDIDRRPVRPGERFGPIDMAADEIRIPIMAEEVVIEKRLVPREVLVIRKRRVAADQIVETTVRREEVRVDEKR
jgi:uncharacterized protein (TIGR02271 family)